MNKSVEYYMSLPYKVDIYPEADGSGFTATIPDLPGCITSSDSIDGLWGSIEEAKMLWLEVAIEDGEHIPEPAPIEEEQFSGKFVARLPRSLHRELTNRAERESTSLNQLVVMLLSEGMGRWHESQDHFDTFSSLFSKYHEVSYRQLEGIYAFVINSLREAPLPNQFEWSWPKEGWKFRQERLEKVLG